MSKFGLAYDGGTTDLGSVRLGSTPSSPTRLTKYHKSGILFLVPNTTRGNMFIIPNSVIKRVWEALPEQLKNSRDWKGFRISNGHLIRETLVYDFGKYKIYLSSRYSNEHGDWPNVKFGYGPSSFVYILHGKTEVVLGRFDRKKKDKKTSTFIATMLIGEGSSFYLSNRSSVIIVPMSPVVYTLSIAVRIPKLEEKLSQEEKISSDRIDELVSIFRGCFPTAQSE